MKFLTLHTARICFGLLWIVLSAVLTGCKTRDKVADGNVLQIVTTTGMIADAVDNIGGDRVKVVSLMGSGVDPHLYKATQGDLEKITGADLLFYNGLHLEGKLEQVFKKAGRLRPVVALAEGIDRNALRKIEGVENMWDPHIWFDVSLWKEAVKTISYTLVKADSLNSDYYKSRTNAYLQKLDSLHAAVKAKILEVPESGRVLITAHDAFGYFGGAYDIEVRGLQGISTLSEFGLRDVTSLVDFIIDRKIKAIFVETSVSQKSIEAVVEGCSGRGWEVKIGGSLYSDAMGESGTPEGTYVGMVNHNVNVIVESLK